jgi:hypothetical protein
MNKFVLIIKHEHDRDLFFGHYSIKILGGIHGKISSEWLSEDTTYLPKSVVITIPDNIINAFFIVVEMGSKFNGVATYTSERCTEKKGFALCNEFETLFRFRTFMRNHHEDFSSI